MFRRAATSLAVAAALVAVPLFTRPAVNPEQLLSHLHDELVPFVKEQKGTLSLASDPLHFLELLAESPSGWRCVLHWSGDENQNAEIPTGPINRNEFHVGVTCNLGLTAEPGKAIMKKRPGGAPSLLRLMQLTRERVRTTVFPEDTSRQPIYLGCDPAILPDGTPLKGYRLRFSLLSADDAAIARG